MSEVPLNDPSSFPRQGTREGKRRTLSNKSRMPESHCSDNPLSVSISTRDVPHAAIRQMLTERLKGW
jgi:hypothetical protein